MNRPGAPVAVWLLLLGALTALATLWSLPWLPLVLLGAALLAPATTLTALLVRGAGEPEVEAIPEVSAATPLGAVGLAALVVGAEAGLWLILIGAGLVIAALVLAARELRQARQARSGR